MKYLKAFMAGIFIPAILFPILYGSARMYGPIYELISLWWIPLLFGIWNVAYFYIGKRCMIKDENLRLFTTGASLGLLVGIALIIENNYTGIDLITRIVVSPFLAAIIWRYGVHYLNGSLDLKEI
jgi:hypothetical protein